MKGSIWSIVLVFCFSQLKSQQNAVSKVQYPEVGKPMPEFLLKNVNYYKKKEVSLSDFKGKWLILDFWNKYCSACIASFPKTNEMQKEFGDRVEFMLVGYQDKEGQIKPMYERFRKNLNLQLACAFDSTLSDYWGIYRDPYIIIVDDKGIVQAITYHLNSSDLQAFLIGQRPVLPVITYARQRKDDRSNIGEQRIPFDSRKPYLINGNGAQSDTDFLFRSVLTKFNQQNQYYYKQISIDQSSIVKDYPRGMFQALDISLTELYFYAYFGKNDWNPTDTSFYRNYFSIPVLEVKDSSLFQSSDVKNRFCYSLILPPEKGSKGNLQRAMQRDLKTYFGYNVKIETRIVPYWRLVATDSAATKLGTQGGDPNVKEIMTRVSYKYSNMPFEKVVTYMLQFTNDVIIDETGITQNVDFTSDDCTDFEHLKAFLPKYGLFLEPAEKEMKVLVIKDENEKEM